MRLVRDNSVTNLVFLFGFGFFLTWTFGTQLVALTGSPFDWLYGILVISVVASVFLARCRVRLAGEELLALPCLQIISTQLRKLTIVEWGCLAAIAAAFLLSIALQYKSSNFTLFWALCIVVGLFTLFRRGRFEDSIHVTCHTPSSASGPSIDLVFIAAVAFGAVFYMFTSIPDTDDSLFLNLAVGAKEERAAVFSKDTMLGIDGLNFIKSTYRLESYQLLSAILSDLTGWSVLFVAHTVVPLLTYLWIASVLTIVHRAFFPQHFAVTLLFHAALLLALDGGLRSFGYHGIPRFFHGKAPFVTGMVPLIVMLTLITLKTNSRTALAFLSASIVISLGFTANAIYIAPLSIALLGLTFLVWGKSQRWRAFSLSFTVIYPLALAIYLLVFDPPGGSQFTGSGSVGGTLWGVMGTPTTMVILLVAMGFIVVAPLFNNRLAPVAFYTLAFLIFVINPMFWPIFGEYVTGHINYRLFWSIPIILGGALFLGVVWMSSHMAIRIGLGVLLLFAVMSPGSITQRATFGFAPLKVPQAEFSVAKSVAEAVNGNALLLAPEAISAWITTLEHAPHVVEGRSIYAPQRFDDEHAQELAIRQQLFDYWDTPDSVEEEPSQILSLLREIEVSAILVDASYPHHQSLISSLIAQGFEDVLAVGDYVLFAHPSALQKM